MANKVSKRNLSGRFKDAGSSKSGRVHVVPSKSGWSVKKEGAKRSSAVRPTKAGAVKVAKNVKTGTRVVIHKKDGTIQKNIKKR